MITKIEQVIEEYQKVFYLEDTSVIPLICAVTIQSAMDGDPIWIWLVGGSSSGKTEIINAVTGVKNVRQISTLTENTFLSGFRKKDGEETSLLRQIGPTGVIVMKDFTSILSMNSEKQQAVMGQLREVFDGFITKATGTGKTLSWKGKINLIAGVTEAIHADGEKFNKMGTRNLFYTFPEQNRKKTTRRAMQNAGQIKFLRANIQDIFTEYIHYMISNFDKKVITLPEDVLQDIEDLTDFVAICTTGVVRNYRGEMELMLSANMPMRHASQAIGLGTTFMKMNDGVLPKWGKDLIYKTALDSIPKQRRMCLTVLAQYQEQTTTEIAMKLGYETDLVGKWLADLNALKVCERRKGTDNGKNRWSMKEEYRKIVQRYDGIKPRNDVSTDSGVSDEESEKEEEKLQAQELFDNM